MAQALATMWNNPAGIAATKGNINQRGFGAIWDFVTLHHDGFAVKELFECLKLKHGYKHNSAKTIWRNFKVYHFTAIEDFRGPKCRLERGRYGSWRLVDGPDATEFLQSEEVQS